MRIVASRVRSAAGGAAEENASAVAGRRGNPPEWPVAEIRKATLKATTPGMTLGRRAGKCL
eukprot:9468483-Alexandrium_andersonii.AAC.1